MLDAILALVWSGKSRLASIVGSRSSTAWWCARIDHLLNIAEYKRGQAAPGVKVTARNFGRDRRLSHNQPLPRQGHAAPQPDETLNCPALARASSEAFDVIASRFFDESFLTRADFAWQLRRALHVHASGVLTDLKMWRRH